MGAISRKEFTGVGYYYAYAGNMEWLCGDQHFVCDAKNWTRVKFFENW